MSRAILILLSIALNSAAYCQEKTPVKFFMEGKAGFQPFIISFAKTQMSDRCPDCIIPGKVKDTGLSFYLSPGVEIGKWQFQFDAGYRLSTFTNSFFIKKIPASTPGTLEPVYEYEFIFNGNYKYGSPDFYAERNAHSLAGGLSIGRKINVFTFGISASLGFTKFIFTRSQGTPDHGIFWVNGISEFSNQGGDDITVYTDYTNPSINIKNEKEYHSGILGNAGIWGRVDISGNEKLFMDISVFKEQQVFSTPGEASFVYWVPVKGTIEKAIFTDNMRRLVFQMGLTARFGVRNSKGDLSKPRSSR